VTDAADKSSSEWGARWAEQLWDSLLARYDPLVDGQTVLDLGCNWGYLLRFFAERFAPAKLIGVDVRPHWRTKAHGWDYESLDGLVEFHEGSFADMDALAPASVDLIVSSSTLQYMTPEEVERSLDKAFSILRPGGEMIVRTRTATSHIGADLHTVFDLPYAQLLHTGPAIEAASAEVGQPVKYLNFLTASSFIAVFARSGFEALDVVRHRNDPKGREELEERIRAALPGVSEDELFCRDLDARLVKAIDPKDLAALGG
jgi:SAM-dependent methyltransferase